MENDGVSIDILSEAVNKFRAGCSDNFSGCEVVNSAIVNARISYKNVFGKRHGLNELVRAMINRVSRIKVRFKSICLFL